MIKINELVAEVIERLKNNGFIIHRYDSMTTNSVYLKLDYGASHSIRISDHKGKKHLKYKFNLQSNIKKGYKKKQGKVERNYYSFKEVNKMIDEIIEHRNRQKMKLGNAGYAYLISKNRFEGQFKKGFWKMAEEV